MNYLLDTHIFLWWDSEPDKLPQKILEQIQNPHNRCYLSLVTLWEITIKLQLGKLTLRQPLSVLVEEQQQNHIELLPLQPTHIFTLEQLPAHHKDPFDRLLIAQAIAEQLTVITVDSQFQSYLVPLLTSQR
ncbi:MAG: type II toxin-antitoxin system VapC family toxin [Gammaproteobacteria bacterium]|nr:type II toxin-antitoxin system VapC family toxin [Gammaproteobacteria bacterium]